MAIDWNFSKLKQQALAKYDQQYWGNIASTYTNMGGRIVWDNNTGKASYNSPNVPLPSLPEMWGQYQRGAKSRGAVADFMTFKKYYEQLKAVKNQQLIGSLQQAQISGIPMDKIHDAISENPGFRDEIVKTISNTADENQRAALAAFVPPIEKTWGQVFTPGVLTGLGAAGLAGYGYSQGIVDDTPEGIRQRQTTQNFADRQRLKNYIANNPRPKAPVESDYKTSKGNWKKKGNTKAKYNKDQATYRKKLDEWKAGRPQTKVDTQTTRSQTWKRRFGGPQSTQYGAVKGAAAMFAPEAIGMLARNAGLSEKSVNQLQAVVSGGITAGYGVGFAKSESDAMKSGKGVKALSKFGTYGKAAALIIFGAQTLGYINQSTKATEAPVDPPKKKYQPII